MPTRRTAGLFTSPPSITCAVAGQQNTHDVTTDVSKTTRDERVSRTLVRIPNGDSSRHNDDCNSCRFSGRNWCSGGVRRPSTGGRSRPSCLPSRCTCTTSPTPTNSSTTARNPSSKSWDPTSTCKSQTSNAEGALSVRRSFFERQASFNECKLSPRRFFFCRRKETFCAEEMFCR